MAMRLVWKGCVSGALAEVTKFADRYSPRAARAAVVFVLAALTGLGAAGPTCAGEPFNLRDALFGRQSRTASLEFPAPTVARYEDDSGQGFIFDRVDGRDALLKFDGDAEIWALTATVGPRGDVIYKNDVGEPILRATRVGGLTLFTSDRPAGMAAAFLGEAPAPRPAHVLGPEGLQLMALQASARASRAAQHLVEFDAPDVNASSEMVFADAFFIVAEAFAHLSEHGRAGQQVLAHVADVRFLVGPSPAAALHGPTVQITIAPQLGIAGRPSSERVVAVITRH